MDLSVEALVHEGHYAHLFTPEELEIAQQRLAQIPRSSFPRDSDGPATLGLGEVADSETHQEGAALGVLVNRYERDPKARAKCIEHHGSVGRSASWTLRDGTARSARASFTYITYALSAD